MVSSMSIQPRLLPTLFLNLMPRFQSYLQLSPIVYTELIQASQIQGSIFFLITKKGDHVTFLNVYKGFHQFTVVSQELCKIIMPWCVCLVIFHNISISIYSMHSFPFQY